MGDESVGSILELLIKGDKELRVSSPQDVVLLLGRTGTGKSTLTQFLAGNDLRAIESSEGNFIITDNSKKICASTIKSCTMIPELVTNTENNTAFYDCPGFGDTRGVGYEIAATYFINKVLPSKSIKIVFTINYYSVQKGGSRDEFLALVKNVFSMFTDISKFKGSICIVVTKVDNTYKRKNREMTLIPDDTVIQNIVNFLTEARDELLTDLKDAYERPKQAKYRKHYQNMINFIEILINEGQPGLPKIGIFRKPEETGPLSKMEILQEGRDDILKMITNRLTYTPCNANDFNHTISADSKLFLINQENRINNNIQQKISTIGKQMINFYTEQERRSSDIEQILTNLNIARSMFQVQTKTDDGSSRKFVEKLVKTLNQLEVRISWENVGYVLSSCENLDFVRYFLKKPTAQSAQLSMGELVRYVEDSCGWYSFLVDLRTTLSEYSVQQNVRRYSDLTRHLRSDVGIFNTASTSAHLNQLLMRVKDDTGRQLEISTLKNLNDIKIRFLRALIGVAFKEAVVEHQDDKVEVKGYNVKMSDVLKLPGVKEAKSVEIFAMNKVFIDANFTKSSGALKILAPQVEVAANSATLSVNGEDAPDLGSAVKTNFEPGSKGQDGIPGLPGGSAGSVVLIGQTCHNCDRLRISAVGGKGGKGQDGGNGVAGADGEPSSGAIRKTPSGNYLINELEMNGYITKCHINRLINKECTIYKPGQKGGSGGDGGEGGKGGNKGNVVVIFSKYGGFGEPAVSRENGSTGKKGMGGHGGGGGYHGDTVHVELVIEARPNPDHYKAYIQYTDPANNTGADLGPKGRDGANNKCMKLPINVNFDPTSSINTFKNYVRQGMKNPITASVLRNVLEYLEVDENVNALYDDMDLVEEFLAMEHVEYSWPEATNQTKSYHHFLDRIVRHAQNLKGNSKPNEYKLVLGYLYAATLSRNGRMREVSRSDVVIDIKGYLKSVKERIRQLEDFWVTVELYKRSRHQRTITEKINEANNLIEEHISSDISSTLKQLRDKIHLIYTESKALDSQNGADQTKLTAKRKQLESLIPSARLLGVLHIASTALAFLGPVAAMTVAGIGSANTVTKDLLLNDEPENYGRSNWPTGVNAALNEIEDAFKERQSFFKQSLAVADEMMEGFNDQAIQEIKRIVNKTQRVLKEKLEKAIGGDPEAIRGLDTVKNELAEALEGQKQVETSQDSIARTYMIAKVQNVLSMADIGVDIYSMATDAQHGVKTLNEAINKAEEQTAELKQLENKIIMNTLLMNQRVKEAVTQVDKYNAALDIGKWKIQNTLREIQKHLIDMADGFETEMLTQSSDKVIYGMTTMIQVFDRIQDYHNQAQLADYVSDITSRTAKSIKVKDQALHQALSKLQFQIHKNIVLSEYDKSISAVRQHIFPYAQSCTEELNLPDHLKSGKHTINDVIRNIIVVLERLERDDKVIQPSDKPSFSEQLFNSRDGQHPPFYVWRYSRNKQVITQLFQGKEVLMTANIVKGLQENAIKFDRVRINFKAHCGKLQPNLSQALDGFSMELTHLGNSYYRCGDGLFSMKHSWLHIIRPVNDGSDHNENNVYRKIKENEAQLSPYTTWKLKIKGGDFNKLSGFTGEKVDLELEGRGRYLARGIENTVCTDDLQQYYVEEVVPMSRRDIVDLGAGDEDEQCENSQAEFDAGKNPNIRTRIKRSITGVTQYMSPFENIANWFGIEQSSRSDSNYPNNALDTSTFNTSEPTTYDGLLLRNNTRNSSQLQAPAYALLNVQSNLLLMDLLIRKATHRSQRKASRMDTSDEDLAHKMAYRAYAPRN